MSSFVGLIFVVLSIAFLSSSLLILVPAHDFNTLFYLDIVGLISDVFLLGFFVGSR